MFEPILLERFFTFSHSCTHTGVYMCIRVRKSRREKERECVCARVSVFVCALCVFNFFARNGAGSLGACV